MQRHGVEVILHGVMVPPHLRRDRVRRVIVRARAEPVRFPVGDVKSAGVLEDEVDEAFEKTGERGEGQLFAEHGAQPHGIETAHRKMKFQLVQPRALRHRRQSQSRRELHAECPPHALGHCAAKLGTVEREDAELARDQRVDRRVVAKIELLENLVQARARAAPARKRVDAADDFRGLGGRRVAIVIGLLRIGSGDERGEAADRPIAADRAGECAGLASRRRRRGRSIAECGGLGHIGDRECAGHALRELLVEWHIRPRLLALPDGERRLTNLLHLAELLHHAAATQRLATGAARV